MPSEQERCETCRWWVKSEKRQEEGQGACHRYPPLALSGGGTRRPWTYKAHFCGEHTPLPEQRKEDDGND